MATENTPIQAVRTSLEIVETLVEAGEASVSELTEELEMPKSTVYEYLRTLKEEGYLINEDGTYHVSTRFLSIGARVRRNHPIYAAAKPELRKLSESTDEHASLMIEENGYGVIIHTAPAEHTDKILAYTGMRTKLHATAPGKAILAHLPQDRQERYIDERELRSETSHTITDPATLREELGAIRDRSYATDREEGLDGIRGVATPVLNRTNGTVEGAISLYGPGSGDTIDQFVDRVLDSLDRTTNIVEVNYTHR